MMMDTDPTIPMIKITEEHDRVIVDVHDEAVTTDAAAAVIRTAPEDVVEAEIVVDEEPTEEFPALSWMPEVWKLQEYERFPNISASVIQTRPLGACYAYLYRTALPHEIVWKAKKFATLEEAKRAVWMWLYEDSRQVSVHTPDRADEPALVADQGLGPCQE